MRALWAKLILTGMGLSGILMTGCDTDPGVPVTTVQSAKQATVHTTTIDRSALEIAEGNWMPVKNWESQIVPRNPFRGFSDSMLVELAQQQMMKNEGITTGEQLPEQLYNVRDYTLVGVITGTAEPKAYVLDPGGNRFVLRRGSLLGNNHGSVASIRRDGIEVYEIVSGEGTYIDIPLYKETRSDIKFTLQ